ncbi:dimeric dihydrodiol dehydrogenase [Penicillium cataractarum]|uniref:D-xylose 1-dehydrogenase (NADP(+), D-xylono-1,5-lactone-forming) n=1 Tax=Penicillium cataractarum TaxID=2100454 RepID=A0A9W9R7Y0_9EURO|nr:dimeric dihydrodiol dehydrogenase [Penicillium cataractarum]KAJ5355382.1 dimeric dihydrodiol dehydrogenase [Penicillium cataractarum]
MGFGALYRIYAGFVSPPPVKKRDDAIRFGLLGASSIAPIALIAPAKAHSEVIIAAVAARDRTRAEAYAKKHNIPIVHSTYEDLLQDPSIDAIYIALPNNLHYEWALRSLRAGKHVLLEKPSCSNAEEARALFTHPLLKAPNAPILLEAFHYRFHPVWQTFLARIHDPAMGRVKNAFVQQYLPKGAIPDNDIRWRFDLAGGAMIDFGTYTMSCLRQIFRQEPSEVLEAKYRGLMSPPAGLVEADQVDQAMTARYRTADGATGSLVADLSASGGWPLLPSSWTKNLPRLGWPKCEVALEERVVEDSEGQTHTVQRNVVIWNHLLPSIYHRVDVEDAHVIRRGEQVVKTWKESKREKAYKWPVGDARAGIEQEWWTSYLYQLHEFVNKVKGREGSGVWVDGEDSIKQMEAVDETYRKAGLKVRPRTAFEL